MLTSFRLQDFKGHRDTTLPLGRLTMLVGPNGAGKTSVLEALWLQSEFVRNQFVPPLTPGVDNDLLRRGSGGAIRLETKGSRQQVAWASNVQITGGSGRLAFEPAWQHWEIAQAIGRAGLYKLNADKIAAAAYSDHPEPGIERDGTNAAVALAAIKLSRDEVFERIERDMRRLVRNVERVRLRPAPVNRGTSRPDTVLGSKIFLDLKGASGVPANAVSEGSLIMLTLLALLHHPNRPDLLLLDDFDQALHPEAQLELVRLIKGLLAEFPSLQIVATTHSPYILDELDAADVHAFALRDDGTVAVKRLSEHPEADKMKGTLSAGQLWSLDPERKWVLAEKAA
jgi:predicted ATPase